MAPDLHVRTARAADVEAIQTLVLAAYAEYVPVIGRPPAPMAADYAVVVAAGETWVAEHGDAIVGVLVLRHATDHLLVENLAVAPASRGRGVGAELLAVADEQARLDNVGEIRLYTNEAMTQNLTYYPRHGYRETHRVTEDGFARVFFSKSLR